MIKSISVLPSAQAQNGERRPWAPPSFLHENVSNGCRMRPLTPARTLHENRSSTRSSRASVEVHGQWLVPLLLLLLLLLLSAFAVAASTCWRMMHSSTRGAQSTSRPMPCPRSTPHGQARHLRGQRGLRGGAQRLSQLVCIVQHTRGERLRPSWT
jgi:hypothetical protein